MNTIKVEAKLVVKVLHPFQHKKVITQDLIVKDSNNTVRTNNKALAFIHMVWVKIQVQLQIKMPVDS